MTGDRPRVGISSCLLGEAVRYDGGHRRHAPLIEALEPFVEWVAVCPELEIGLGVPRPPIDLYDAKDGLRLRMADPVRDLTHTMQAYAAGRIERLRALELSGYVLKSKSPSCGLGSARVLDDQGTVLRRDANGMFADALARLMPGLPMAEDTEFADSASARAFLDRVRAYRSGRGW